MHNTELCFSDMQLQRFLYKHKQWDLREPYRGHTTDLFPMCLLATDNEAMAETVSASSTSRCSASFNDQPRVEAERCRERQYLPATNINKNGMQKLSILKRSAEHEHEFNKLKGFGCEVQCLQIWKTCKIFSCPFGTKNAKGTGSYISLFYIKWIFFLHLLNLPNLKYGIRWMTIVMIFHKNTERIRSSLLKLAFKMASKN